MRWHRGEGHSSPRGGSRAPAEALEKETFLHIKNSPLISLSLLTRSTQRYSFPPDHTRITLFFCRKRSLAPWDRAEQRVHNTVRPSETYKIRHFDKPCREPLYSKHGFLLGLGKIKANVAQEPPPTRRVWLALGG